jgi:PII-like signaling protein
MCIVDEKQNLQKMLPEIKQAVRDNGLVTLHEVDVL